MQVKVNTHIMANDLNKKPCNKDKEFIYDKIDDDKRIELLRLVRIKFNYFLF
jgi:hypothetical protein